MEDFPALLLTWIHRQHSYWEKSKGHDKVCPRKPHGTNGMLRRPNGKLMLGQSVGSFKFVADQWSRKRPLEPAEPSHSSCPQALFKTGKTYNKTWFERDPSGWKVRSQDRCYQRMQGSQTESSLCTSLDSGMPARKQGRPTRSCGMMDERSLQGKLILKEETIEAQSLVQK